MNEQIKLVVGLLFAIVFIAQADTLQSDSQNATGIYGDAQGVLINIDSLDALHATATPALTNGTTYSIDSLQLRIDTSATKFTDTKTVYLAVYTNRVAKNGTLSGFAGVSTNAVTLTDQSGITNVVWHFSNLTVVPESNQGDGNDERTFVFQSNNTAQPSLNANYDIPLMISQNKYIESYASVVSSGKLGADWRKNPDYILTLHTGSGTTPVTPEIPMITDITISGGVVFITATNLTNTIKYNLVRAENLTDPFTNVVDTIEATNQVNVFEDSTPLEGEAFYKVQSK